MRGISNSLGIIFAVLIAILLVLIVSFSAFNFSTNAVKSQTGLLVIVGQPVALYNQSSDSIAKIMVTVKNPSGENINLTGIEIKGSTIYLKKPAIIPPSEKVLLTFYDREKNFRFKLKLDVMFENGTVRRYASSWGNSLTDATQGKVSGDVRNGYIEFHLLTDRGAFKVYARIEVVG